MHTYRVVGAHADRALARRGQHVVRLAPDHLVRLRARLHLVHHHRRVLDFVRDLVNRLCPVSKKWEKDDFTPPQCRYDGGRCALFETVEGSTIPLTSRHLPSGTKTSVFVNAQKLHTAGMVSRLKVVSEVSNMC